MIDKTKLFNSISNESQGYNILKNPITTNVSSTYNSYISDSDVTNFIMNSNLENEDIIK
ncbi:hypothetical protein I3900191A7_02090 [Clostridium baratii]|uniref:Uncharacterized protein n=2 Tax=Clostridium TaxID=1485 RepID=A0A0A7FZT7_9CLOT|nr:hypothetical protein [Clostridium baratii]AIY84316.1 hypothetical protein U729_1317 [Clostridium baratii str. Sullivan]MBS6042233.1 hypothetical protein [Clostridium baratii]MBT9831772.1 hypothetical protein [Clostridium baratii]MDU1055352.1 hypothetical protein [Clostridium baratii]MDU4912754.1 hypothetical protein [Clostridium baratii]